MITIFSINELTAPWFAILALVGRKPVVLLVDPFFPPFRRVLESIVERAIADGRARWIIDLCPEKRPLWDYPLRTTLHDVFGQIEAWHNEYYGFDGLDDGLDDYAMTYKHITCNRAKPLHFHALLLGAALDNLAGRNVRVVGLAEDALGVMEAYWGRDFAPTVMVMPVPHRLFNIAITFVVQAYSLAWVMWRTRPTLPSVETFFLAADYYQDKRDFRLYHEIADGGPLLLVLRHPRRQEIESYEELRQYKHCSCRDGLFGPWGAMAAAAMVVRDGGRLFWRFGGVQPALYYRVSTLPFRRAVLRAFFTRFRPRYFWGRDDYNEEHILRRQELHQIGGTSLGINHGYYPAYTLAFPQIRYISFDRYYVFGRAVYERVMKDTWAKDMTVVPVGTFGASREDYERRFAPKPPDIVVYSAVFVGDPRMVDFVRGLAEVFPDRTLLLQIKRSFVVNAHRQKFAEDCTENLANVKTTVEPLFDLTTKARYAFSDPSTAVVEALQFGQYSFCIDLAKEQKTSIYRYYPEICVSSAFEAAQRINAIEAGKEAYPRNSLGDLVDLSGRVIFDVIREDLGLPSKEPASAVQDLG